MVRLFGGDPGGTRNGPAVPSPRGTWWSPPDCLSTSSAALGRCVSRRATTTTGQHRLLTAPGLPNVHAHWRNRASRSPTGGTIVRVRPRVRKSGLGLQNLTLVVQLQPQKNTKCRPWMIREIQLGFSDLALTAPRRLETSMLLKRCCSALVEASSKLSTFIGHHGLRKGVCRVCSCTP